MISEKKSLTVTLHQLLVIVNELRNKELNEWIKSELNGYGNNQQLPDYRKNLPFENIYSGINGRLNMTNQPLPMQAFGQYYSDVKSLNKVTSSILELDNLKDGVMKIDLTSFAGMVQENTGISCYNISMKFGRNVSDIILSNVKTKLIESLLLLEKEFGILDNLYIEARESDKEKINEVNKEILSFLFSNDGEY